MAANNEEIVKLVLARLSAMPDNIQIHVGLEKRVLDKEELIKHVKKQDQLGKRFVQLQLAYIKSTIKGFS